MSLQSFVTISVQVVSFKDVEACGTVDEYQRFRNFSASIFKVDSSIKMDGAFPPKSLYSPTRLHYVTVQKTRI
jgi:hypothetical protein